MQRSALHAVHAIGSLLISSWYAVVNVCPVQNGIGVSYARHVLHAMQQLRLALPAAYVVPEL